MCITGAQEGDAHSGKDEKKKGELIIGSINNKGNAVEGESMGEGGEKTRVRDELQKRARTRSFFKFSGPHSLHYLLHENTCGDIFINY